MNHSALQPVTANAQAIADLWWGFLAVTAAVYVAVCIALVIALSRARRNQAANAAGAELGRGPLLVIGAATVLTVLTLGGLLSADFVMGRMARGREAGNALHLRVTGHQYWWEIQYLDPQPARGFVTANEIHVPVNQPITVELRSADVIHSFWLPNVSGKRDLIPGYTNKEHFMLLQPGRFEGQCAEFCGYEHARMKLSLQAESAAQFASWQELQRADARTPANPNEQRGQQVFLSASCVLCHSIQGTAAAATIGPDLTHLASRQTLAAGTLANTPANLARWIVNPQHLKPGVRMPDNVLSADDLNVLVAYLQSLQ